VVVVVPRALVLEVDVIVPMVTPEVEEVVVEDEVVVEVELEVVVDDVAAVVVEEAVVVDGRAVVVEEAVVVDGRAVVVEENPVVVEGRAVVLVGKMSRTSGPWGVPAGQFVINPEARDKTTEGARGVSWADWKGFPFA